MRPPGEWDDYEHLQRQFEGATGNGLNLNPVLELDDFADELLTAVEPRHTPAESVSAARARAASTRRSMGYRASGQASAAELRARQLARV